MTKYREILRLLSLGISERKIAESCGVSRNTVSRIRKRADEIGLKWPLDEQFFSLAELNIAIRDKLRTFNSKIFQKKEGSRISIFLGEEKPLLMPLPAIRYELATWKKATVQFNYHV